MKYTSGTKLVELDSNGDTEVDMEITLQSYNSTITSNNFDGVTVE